MRHSSGIAAAALLAVACTAKPARRDSAGNLRTDSAAVAAPAPAAATVPAPTDSTRAAAPAPSLNADSARLPVRQPAGRVIGRDSVKPIDLKDPTRKLPVRKMP